MPSFCTSASFRKPIANADGTYTIQIAGDSKLHEYNGLPLKELSVDEYMSRAAPPVMLQHGWKYVLPVGITKEICYNDSSDIWAATFSFVKDDDMAAKVLNQFKQGLLYASISWYIDELSRSWRDAERKLNEWSLTATPRDVTVLESFSNHPQTFTCSMCNTNKNSKSEKTYTQAELDAALQKQADEHQSQLDRQSQSYSEKLTASEKKGSERMEKLEAKFTALEDKRRADELTETYSDLLPDDFEASTPREVLVKACGNMLEENKKYSLPELKKIADNLVVDRKNAKKPEPKPGSFSGPPSAQYTGDLFLDVLTSK